MPKLQRGEVTIVDIWGWQDVEGHLEEQDVEDRDDGSQ